MYFAASRNFNAMFIVRLDFDIASLLFARVGDHRISLGFCGP